ncbi:MAG: hypothetical protein Q9169_004017 [Polycauliona sp. 2 TL-2023]
MPGAARKRVQENRQAPPGYANPQGSYGQPNPGRYDGPSDRPRSSSGPPRPGSSRGGPPSNAPQGGPPSNQPGASVRSGSRPRSGAGPGSASGTPLRDPARDPPAPSGPKLPSRVDWGGNLYSYYSNEPSIIPYHWHQAIIYLSLRAIISTTQSKAF